MLVLDWVLIIFVLDAAQKQYAIAHQFLETKKACETRMEAVKVKIAEIDKTSIIHGACLFTKKETAV